MQQKFPRVVSASVRRGRGRRRGRAAGGGEAGRVEALQPRQLMSVTLNAQGWTDVGPSADTQVVYVSSSAGNDLNTGLSEAAPVKTIAKGRSLLRDGMPDHLLLKRGDAWYESLSGNTWFRSGRDADEPMLIGSYGDAAAPRPAIRTGAGKAFDLNGKAIHDLVIQGIHFQAHTRDPDSPEFTGTAGDAGLRLVGAAQRLLLEDNLVEAYRENIGLDDYAGRHADVRLRRNVVVDAYATASGGKSQGMYVDGVDRITIEGNLFDHNGWDPRVSTGAANIYSHNIYMDAGNTAVVVRDNVIADASSHGLQARSGGQVTGNLFLRNPIHMTFGLVNGAAVAPGGVTGTVADNVYLDSRDINGAKRGWALEASNIKAGGGTSFHGNIFANDATQRSYAAVILSYGSNVTNNSSAVGINDLTIRDNIVFDWYRAVNTNSGLVPGGTGYNALNGLVVANNDAQEVSSAQLVTHGGPYSASAERWEGNRYFDSTAASSGWFVLNGATLSMESWQAQVEATAQKVKQGYADPGRDAADYNASIGGTGSLAAFLAECRLQSRTTWRPAYTAAPANAFVRDGYALRLASPTGVSATATSSSEIRLDWSHAGGAEGGFRVERAPGGTTSFTALATVGATARSYADAGLPDGTRYDYRVIALPSSGEESQPSATASAITRLPAPAGLAATATGPNTVALSWTDAADNEGGYVVEHSADGATYAEVARTAPDATGYVHGAAAGGSTNHYRVTAFNAAGAPADPAAVSVATPNTPPVVDAGAVVSAVEGALATFAGSITDPDPGQTHTIQWTFGDRGTAAGSLTPTHTYAENGTYTATLSVTDSAGATATDTTLVTVANAAPAVTASAGVVGAAGTATNFSGSFTDAGADDTHTLLWDFGDGQTDASGTLTPSHVYSLAGSYTVTLTVTDDDGGKGTGTTTIKVPEANRAPVVDAGAAGPGVEGAPVSFSGSFSDADADQTHTIEWAFGDGGTASGSLTPTHAYAENGTYTATLTVTDSAGAASSDTVNVTVANAAPAVEVSAGVVGAAGTATDFAGAISDAGTKDTHTVSWNFGDGTITTPQDAKATGALTPSHVYEAAGTYTVVLTATDDDGGTGTGTTTVTVAAAPVAPAAPSGLTAAPASLTQIDLGWADNSGDEDGFHVERSTDGVAFARVASVAANVNAYSATGLSSGTTYYFRVQAYNEAGTSGYSNTADATTPAGAVVLQQNTSGGDKVDVKRGQKGAQSFRHGTAGTAYTVTKLKLHVSREKQLPNASLVVSVGTAANAGTLPGGSVSIAPSTITNTSAGSTFQEIEVTFAAPLTLDGGKTYYLNFECEASNGKTLYLEYAKQDAYAGGTYLKHGSDDGKDIWFQLFGY